MTNFKRIDPVFPDSLIEQLSDYIDQVPWSYGWKSSKSKDFGHWNHDFTQAAVENGLDWRKSLLFREWARNDPLDQHWHLGPIGVLPSHQGFGIGSELMQRFCNEVDACLAKAYLETDLDQNVRFYEKFGFKVVSESEIFHVKNRYMLRDSRA